MLDDTQDAYQYCMLWKRLHPKLGETQIKEFLKTLLCMRAFTVLSRRLCCEG